jgi:sodium transport system ATP-binding protein
MSGQVMLEAQQLSKSFQDRARGMVRAVDGVSFQAAAGEILGLLGPNGAGKTTSLRMLATLMRPSSGTARIAGHDIIAEPEQVRAAIGFHTASFALYPRLTVRETLVYFGRLNGHPEHSIGSRAGTLIERFGMSEYADVRIDKLSTGMKQKAAIARTVVHDPPVLIFDEPTAGLDVLAAIDTHAFLDEARAAGRTLLLSTHVMSEAEKLCDRIAVIDHGRILACDTLEGLRRLTGRHYLEDIFVALVRGGADP